MMMSYFKVATSCILGICTLQTWHCINILATYMLYSLCNKVRSLSQEMEKIPCEKKLTLDDQTDSK